MGNLPSGIVTFVFTDIEGSTRRWVEDPSMRSALARHDDLTRAAVAAHSGHVVKHTGDGFMVVFDSPTAALAAVADLQRTLLLDDWGDRPLRVRIGVHTAEARPDGDDYFGAEVSTAARVMGAAHGGQVLVSGPTAELVGGHLPEPLEVRRLGSFHLPDLPRPLVLHQLSAPTIPDEFPPPRSRETNPTNLPEETSSFVGRAEELDAIEGLAHRNRLVTLTGVGGAGKTRLALRVGRRLTEHHPDGVWLVQLAATTSGGDVVDRFVEALRVPDGPGPPGERLAEHVAGRELLVVVDNCEHVLDDAARLVEDVLRSGPAVSVLATSREALGIGGEVAWRVPSLDPSGDAVELFVERARQVNPGFEPSPAEAASIAEVCRRLDGIPLAIELAAARVGSLGVASLHRRLDDRFRILTGGSRTALPRQRTLAATIEWSYRLLSPLEQELLARLSVFVGAFDLEAAEAVATSEDVGPADVLDGIPSLVDKSMLTAEAGTAGALRYRLLETIRQFAADRLGDAEAIAARDRHLDWFSDWVVDAESEASITDDHSRITAAAENLQAALDWCGGDRPEAHGRLAHGVGSTALLHGETSRALELVDRALADVGGLTAITEARLRSRHAVLMTRVSDATGDVAAEIRAVGSLVDDEPASIEKAIVLLRLAGATRLAVDLDPDDALPLCRSAVDVAEAVGDPRLRIVALTELGMTYTWAGRPMEGETTALTGLRLAEEMGDRALLRSAIGSLLFTTLGRRPEAYRRYAEQLFAAFPPDRYPSSPANGDIYWTLLRLGRVAEAERSRRAANAARSLEGWDRVGDLVGGAMAAWMQGDLERADTDLRVLSGEGLIERWAHDIFSLTADVAADRGELDRVLEASERYWSIEVHPSEVPMRAGVVFPHVRAEVEAVLGGTGGDLVRAKASVNRVRDVVRSREHHLSVQIEPPHAYLAMAEAELTRADEPSPGAWSEARSEAVTEYWRTYTEIRCAEALLATGEPTGVDLAETRANAERMGLWRLVALADTIAHTAGDRPS